MATARQIRGAGARIVRLLQCIAEGEPDISLKTLAKRIDLPPSTVHRLLEVLVKTNMVERAERDSYRLGRELYRLGSLIVQKFAVHRIAKPFLRELWAEWQETCSFCLYRPADRTLMVVETIKSPHALQFVLEPLASLSLTWGSLGRSVLAHLPDEEVEHVLAQAVRGPLSGRPPPSRSRLRDELKRIRRNGYAVYEDRAVLDIAGVAAAVFGPDRNVLGCIGVTMPASRFKPGARADFCAAVALRAQGLSAAIGFDGQPG